MNTRGCATGDLESRATFDADAMEVFRLRSPPVRVSGGPSALAIVNDPSAEGYHGKSLPGRDAVVRVHHRSGKSVKLPLSEWCSAT
jgi:hypothetical protein